MYIGDCSELVIARLACAMLSKYHYGMWAWRHAQTSLCGWHNWRGTGRGSNTSELIKSSYIIACLTTLNNNQVRLCVLLVVWNGAPSTLLSCLNTHVCDKQEKEVRLLNYRVYIRVVFYEPKSLPLLEKKIKSFSWIVLILFF